MLSEKWRSMIIDSGTPSVRMPPFNQAEPSAVSRRSRVFPPARRESQAPRAPMNGSASIHSGATTIDTPFRVKNTQGGNCGTRSYELHRNRDEEGRQNRSPQLPDTHAHGVLLFPFDAFPQFFRVDIGENNRSCQVSSQLTTLQNRRLREACTPDTTNNCRAIPFD